MKTLVRLAGVLALLGLLACSCSKGKDNPYDQLDDGTVWKGEIETLVWKGGVETITYRPITLTFFDDGQRCSVLYGSQESQGKIIYEVKWFPQNSFAFDDGNTIEYSGHITGEKMRLIAMPYSRDGRAVIAIIYFDCELTRKH